MLTTPNKSMPSEPLDDPAWDAKLAELDGSFLQSAAWARFQEASGLKTHRLHGKDWACMLIEHQSRLRHYLLAPYGPTLATPSAYPKAMQVIADYAQKLGAQWVRTEATAGITHDTPTDSYNIPSGISTKTAPKQVNPRYTRIVDIGRDDETILASISSSTRSLIRQSDKKGLLTYSTSSDPKDMKLFLAMMHAVSDRNHVHFHTDDYFLKQAEVLMPTGGMRLELALHEGKPVAGIVMHTFNKVATYTYAASLPEARDLNAAALLMWHGAILNSKRQGATTLDLFGVAAPDAPANHPWQGFSSFKRKFGGEVMQRAITTDIPLKASYHSYRAMVKAKRRLG